MRTHFDSAIRPRAARFARMRLAGCLAGTAIALLVLAGCGSSGGSGGGGQSSSSSDVLSTASTKLGTVVVDTAGKTVYFYDKDVANSGRSACTGGCAGLWPAVTSTSMHPSVMGVTGTVGTIAASGGGRQVTLNGLPLYTYAGDSGPGAVSGQGVQGIWWAASPAGKKITGSGGGSYSY